MESRAERMLIVVDMIGGFIREGALSDKGIEAIIPKTVHLVEQALKRGDSVIAFRDCHKMDSPEFASFPPHCLEGSAESELIDELKPFEKHMTVLLKNSTSGFVVPEFRALIENMEELREVVVIGCCTDICILGLALPLKNYFNEMGRVVEVIVPQNAVETYDLPEHPRAQYNEMAFLLLKQAGIKVPDELGG